MVFATSLQRSCHVHWESIGVQGRPKDCHPSWLYSTRLCGLSVALSSLCLEATRPEGPVWLRGPQHMLGQQQWWLCRSLQQRQTP
jgi:hypothetical protein